MPVRPYNITCVRRHARLVKWLRRSPLTAESRVRVPVAVPTFETPQGIEIQCFAGFLFVLRLPATVLTVTISLLTHNVLCVKKHRWASIPNGHYIRCNFNRSLPANIRFYSLSKKSVQFIPFLFKGTTFDHISHGTLTHLINKPLRIRSPIKNGRPVNFFKFRRS